MLNTKSKQSYRNPRKKVFENQDLLRYISSYITGESFLSKNEKVLPCIPGIPHFFPIRMTFREARELILKENLCSRKEDYVSSLSLIEWAIQMGCDFHENESLCRHAAAAGNLEVLEWALKQNPPYTFGKQSIKQAAKHGNLDVLRYLFKNTKNFSAHLKEWTGAIDDDCESFELDTDICSNAAYHGHFETLQWFRNLDPPCPWGVSTLFSAVASGRVDMVEWILDQEYQQISEVLQLKINAIAALYGHIPMLDFFKLKMFALNRVSGYAAASNGHLHVLKWLRLAGLVFDETTFAAAVSARDRNAISWLFYRKSIFVYGHDSMGLPACTQKELKLMCEFLRSGDNPCPVDDQVSYCAISTRNYDLLVWLKERVFCPWDEFCASLAIQQGDLDLLKKMADASPPCPLPFETTLEAASSKNLEILKWLRSRDPPCPWDENCWKESLDSIDVIYFLMNGGCPWDEEVVTRVAQLFFRKRYLEVMRFFREQNPLLQWDTECWYGVVQSGHLEDLDTQNMLNFLKSQGSLCPLDSSVLIEAVESGNLSTLQWLISQDPPCPMDLKKIIIKAAEIGDLEIIKWIYSYTKTEFSVVGFLCLAFSKHIKVFEWLKYEHSAFYELTIFKEELIVLRNSRMSTADENSIANNVKMLQWINEQL